jgi:hypothetical protein
MIIIEKYLEKSFIIKIYVLSLPPVEQLECVILNWCQNSKVPSVLM